MKGKRKRALIRLWRWARPVIVLIVVLSAMRSSLADWNDVPTGSMSPSILPGERVFVNKLAYDLKVPFTTWHIAEWAHPNCGDVVVFYCPQNGKRMVKRVIGLPGDRIELRDNRLLINGEPQAYRPEPVNPDSSADAGDGHIVAEESLKGRKHSIWLMPDIRSARWFGPVTVPQGQYFMMGDNRDNSRDSRWFGCVPRSQIVGRAVAVITSVDPSRLYRPRWRRFFTPMR